MKYLRSCFAIALLSHAAHADMQLTMTDAQADRGEPAGQTTISIRDGKVLFQQAEDGAKFSVLYNSANGDLTQIDHDNKMYMVMDKKMRKDTANQMSEMMKQVEAQLANIPAAQREAMMKAMPGLAQGMGEKPEKSVVDFEWTGEKMKVAGYKCKVARVMKNGTADGKACIASPRELGMSKNDFETLATMFDTMKEFADTMSDDDSMPDMREVGGFPISTSDPDSGVTSKLTEASNSSLDSAMFKVPASYSERSMPGF